jgi:hypothetical protein
LATIPPDKSKYNRRGRFGSPGLPGTQPWKRLINGLKQFRRIATRYEKRAVNHLAIVIIVVILLLLGMCTGVSLWTLCVSAGCS